MKRIIVTITPTGEVSIETKGYIGTACKMASRPFENALGIKTKETLTKEYHRRDANSNKNDATQ